MFKQATKLEGTSLRCLTFNPNLITIIDEDGQHPQINLPTDKNAISHFGDDFSVYLNNPSIGFSRNWFVNDGYTIRLYSNSQGTGSTLSLVHDGTETIIGNFGTGFDCFYISVMYNDVSGLASIYPVFALQSRPNVMQTGNIQNPANARNYQAIKGKTSQSTDPYDDDGDEGGGDGERDNRDENVELPELPTVSASDCGFITLFKVSIANVRALASYMWSDNFNPDTFKRLFADPMDCILGLSIIPMDVTPGTLKMIKFGGTETGVFANAINSQYVRIDCGSLSIKENYNNYMDYAPYTHISIFLPFCGVHQLSVDDVMKKTISVFYDFDILTGSCVAHIKVSDGSSSKVLYNFAGQCSISVPITSRDWTQSINGAINAVATGVGSVMTGNVGALAQGALGAVQASKPTYKRSGSLSGPSGMFDIKHPYVIITRPNISVASRQNTFKGYPLNSTKKLSTLSGFTQIDTIHLDNLSCTDNEKREIEGLLRGGVIL